MKKGPDCLEARYYNHKDQRRRSDKRSATEARPNQPGKPRQFPGPATGGERPEYPREWTERCNRCRYLFPKLQAALERVRNRAGRFQLKCHFRADRESGANLRRDSKRCSQGGGTAHSTEVGDEASIDESLGEIAVGIDTSIAEERPGDPLADGDSLIGTPCQEGKVKAHPWYSATRTSAT